MYYRQEESGEYLDRDKASWQGPLVSQHVLLGQWKGKQGLVCDLGFSKIIAGRVKGFQTSIQSGNSGHKASMIVKSEVLHCLRSLILIGPFFRANLRQHSAAAQLQASFYLCFLLARACRHWAQDLNSGACHIFDSRRPFCNGGR